MLNAVRSNTPPWATGVLSLLALGLMNPAGNAQQPSDLKSGREVLDYSVEWKLINAGTAKYTYTPMPNSAVAASEVRLHLESTGLVSKFFRVNDDYTAMLNQNFCAQSSFLSAHEGNRNRETRITYDSKSRKASYLERDLNKKGATVTHEVDIPPCVYDVVGGMMALRNLRLEPGKTGQLPLSDGKKTVAVKVESQLREEIKTAQGPVKAIRYEVFLFNNVMYKRQGHLHIWLSDDSRRVPVQIQVRLQFTIGTITLRLEKEEKL